MREFRDYAGRAQTRFAHAQPKQDKAKQRTEKDRSFGHILSLL
jgi:hypothetical protein